MDSNFVYKLIQEALDENQELFLIDCQISVSGSIEVVIDGDHGANLEECIRVSRHIEHNLDREEFDFSLTVSTPDITKPISNPRQYKKNIGRILSIQTENRKIEGELIDFKEDNILLEYQERVPKTIGKGKQTVVKQELIPLETIKKANVKIVYN